MELAARIFSFCFVAGCTSGASSSPSLPAPVAPQPMQAANRPASTAVDLAQLVGTYADTFKVEVTGEPEPETSVTDCFVVVKRPDGFAAGVETYGDNLHSCAFTGALRQDSTVWLDDRQGCRIELVVSNEKLELKRDVPADCSSYACGAGMGVLGATFERRGRRAVPAAGKLCANLAR